MARGFEGEFAGTDRFEVIRRLGAGGMGVVYQAYDRERARSVALKTLRHRDAAALYRLKREFRGLADISHPNLAALHELVSAGDEWFFTMELVEGVDFITWVRGEEEPGRDTDADPTAPTGWGGLDPDHSLDGAEEEPGNGERRAPDVSPPRSYDCLRDALRQLAEGVQVLHQAGKLHRDIKPSNVMVDRSGRVVLLDFGLITDVSRSGGVVSDEYSVVGTVDYMSPEQGASLPLGPASDWYAVGSVLYRALTGTLPFTGPPIVVLMDKQRREPEPPAEVLPGTPEDLSQLCIDLMRCDPAARPDGDEILRRLGSLAAAPPAPGRQPHSRSQDAPLVGRGAHAQVLRDAFGRSRRDGQAVTVLVHGRSGMGKSMLIGRVARELARERGAVVLSGRCYERESVPYKALDSLVDALSRYLAQLPRSDADALMPRDVLAVARLFPILRRVDSVKAARRRAAALDPHELRRHGTAALRELLARMADRRPLVLVIDDMQWGDLDSTALLLDLLRPPEPPALLMVLAYRSEEAESSEAVRSLVEGLRAPAPGAASVREVEVGMLSPDEARELALARLQRDGAEGDELAAAIARESAGDPFLVDQLVRFLQASERPAGEVSFGDVMRARLEHLGPEARRLLELVAVAGQPLAQQVAARAAGLDAADQGGAVLRAGSLIRTSGAPELGRVETYHDRIREAVIATLSEARQRECHLALADALEASEHPDPEALAVHLLGGGAIERGVEYAIEAAVKAAAALAFERAAVFHRLAIDALPADEVSRRRLRAARGDALVNAGRGADAAAEYLLAAEGIPAAEALELRRRAAEQLLRCGHVDEGLRALDTVLGAVGMKLAPTPRRAMWSFLRHRMRTRLRGLGFRERDPSQVSAERLTRVDICWSVAAAIGLLDPVRGLEFQTRHLLLALAAGEPRRIARALAVEAGYTALGGRRGWRRTQRLIGLAHETAERIDEPHARGLVAMARGMADLQVGQWRGAFGHFEHAAAVLRAQCTGTIFEIANSVRLAIHALFQLGQFAELCRRVPQYLAEAERRGDLYGANGMRLGLPNAAWLVVDDPAAARAECERGSACFLHPHDFYLQHYFDLVARTHIDLYAGDGAAAHRRLEERWPRLAKSKLLRIQSVRADALFLRARAGLAASTPDLDAIEAVRARLARQEMPGAQAQAILLAGGLARARGDSEQAISLLARAEARFVDAEMEFAAAAARYRRGELAGGDGGRELMADGERAMRAQTIRNPAAMARLVVP